MNHLLPRKIQHLKSEEAMKEFVEANEKLTKDIADLTDLLEKMKKTKKKKGLVRKPL